MERRGTSLRRSEARLALVAALLFALAPVALAESDSLGEEIWITLGNDAFEALNEQPDMRPLDKLATQSDVVLSRVRVEDLETISLKLHDLTGRCAGFIAHRTLEQAQQALATADRTTAARGDGYTMNQPELVQSFEAEIQKPMILNTIDHLSTAYPNRFNAHPSGVAAAEWIRDTWAGYAQFRPEVTVDLVAHSGIAQRSVVMTIPGTTWPEEVVILGGHLDSIASGSSNPNFSAPGADDDASGIATLTEVIRVAMVSGFYPQRTVQFMGYAAEEIGLVGSQDIAASYQAANTDVVAVLQLDMVGYFGSTTDIAFIGDFTNGVLTNFLGQLVDTYQPHLSRTMTFCGYGCSDHAAWHNAGFPAAFPFEARFGQHNPTIHTTQDTLATLGNSVDHAYKFARLAAAYAVEIGNPVVSIIFESGFESGNTDEWSLATP